MSESKRPRSIGIHDGNFHADEVSACALLIYFGLADASFVVRTRDPAKLAACEFVCDVGGVYQASEKLFDHHQVSYQGDYSSAGMILQYLLEEEYIDELLYDYINNKLILGVDAIDNGRVSPQRGHATFSDVISNYNVIEHDASEEQENKQFGMALEFTLGHLDRLIQRYQYTRSCRKLVQEAMQSCTSILSFDKAIPWLESFFELGGVNHPALFIIMPCEGRWKLRGIPPNYEERMKVRVPLPQNWAGLLEKELSEVSGISGAVFCHKGRFISVWETREAALQAFEKVMAGLQKV